MVKKKLSMIAGIYGEVVCACMRVEGEGGGGQVPLFSWHSEYKHVLLLSIHLGGSGRGGAFERKCPGVR
jgi:hypothetical protein